MPFSPYGNDPITSTDDDFAELDMLKPKTYKSMESDDFMKSKYKHMYAPIKSETLILEAKITLNFRR